MASLCLIQEEEHRNMPTPTETVEAFLAACATSKEGMAKAFHDYFTPDAIWENVGLMTTKGPEEAIALMAQFESQLGCVTMVVDNLAIAAQGNKVLTERVDHLLKADGSEAMAARVMGIFEVENGKITAWRDYFDTAGMMGGGQA
jgi:limonene-1,2-epoxide hydrolase